jgi:hypothetical protein
VAEYAGRTWHDLLSRRVQVGDKVMTLMDCRHEAPSVVERHPETGQIGCWAPEICPQCGTVEICLDDLEAFRRALRQNEPPPS